MDNIGRRYMNWGTYEIYEVNNYLLKPEKEAKHT